ncbi:hypothetical protein KBD61_00715 [Patescibacteria group bacterium]|nr:hypothetical protein [Patescibacteria group bacterium]MBP9709529.1 hypothetical protein [Patescibacteria group bacterium]
MLTSTTRPFIHALALLGVIVTQGFLNTHSAHAAASFSGRILLQVQERGQAWYINPVDSKRVYLKDGDTAYQLMKKGSLGMRNSDLMKIPVGYSDLSRLIMREDDQDSDEDGLSDALERAIGTNAYSQDTDGDGFTDSEELRNDFNPLGTGKWRTDSRLVARLKGRLLLQVESRGEVWYLNPVDNKRYFLADGKAAYNLMRWAGLGATNATLNTIPVSSLLLNDSPVATQPSTDQNCGSDINCFIQAANTCTRATVHYTSDIQVSDVKHHATTLLRIDGGTPASCQLFLQTEERSSAYTSSTQVFDLERTALALINQTNEASIGMSGMCTASSNLLTTVFNRWKAKTYAKTDFEPLNCSGAFFDARRGFNQFTF